MCRWLAYSGSPILIKEALYEGPQLACRSEPALAARSRADQRRRVRRRLVRRPRHPGRLPQHRAGLERPATCASSPATSAHRCSSPISGRRSAARCSRPTATPSATTAGCSCTTDTSTSSRRSSATSCSPSTRRSIRRSRARPTPKCCSTSLSPSASRTTRRLPSSRRSGSSRRSPAATASRIRSRARSRPPKARPSGRSGTPARETRARCSIPPTSQRSASIYPERQLFQEVSDNARLIVSEPLGDVAGVWNEVPESTYGIVGPDHAEMRPFQPKTPSPSMLLAS